MPFNSVEFALFLPVVFILYWFVFRRSLLLQNLFVVAASYFFYASWDWRFLPLLFGTSLTVFIVGFGLARTEKPGIRKAILGAGLLANLGVLCFFKYYSFFASSLAELLQAIGVSANPWSLRIILPVGLSFYTFQAMSYIIDAYRKEIRPTGEIVQFLAYMGFFPQLVAGPIGRAKTLLPQFARARTFDHASAVIGMRRILWGLFKKVVVADSCARHVDAIFADYQSLGASTLLVGIIYFAFQIYGDFSGYSDVAIGVARLFGFNLTENFRLPYLSRDVREFWTRWHISLSSWFRDYVYIPLGGSRHGTIKRIRNVILTFACSGLWHGDSWRFILWGVLNGIYCVPSILTSQRGKHAQVVAQGRMLPMPREVLEIAVTFGLILVSWVFFRAASLQDAVGYLRALCSPGLFSLPGVHGAGMVFVLTLVGVEWVQRDKGHPMDIGELPGVARWIVYVVISVLILAYHSGERTFIYAQF
jgi:alginate O-acetyltransferase complex protein AlgI